MRKIRIGNLNIQNLIHVVVALKDNGTFFVRKKFYLLLIKEAASNQDGEMSFISWYGDHPIKTIVKFKEYCDEYLMIESITVDNNLLFRHSFWTSSNNQVVIDAE